MKRSFADFEDKQKLACFSDKNDKLPHEITHVSGRKMLFDCDKCLHTFYKRICHVTMDNSWCPYCSDQLLCGDIECTYCFEKSYAYHAGELAKHWSDRNTKKAHEVIRGSGTKYFHHCVECDHHFLMSPQSIIGKDTWCNFCANRARCPESDNCEKCFANTFASYDPEKVACWSSSNEKGPYEFAVASHHYAFFDCDVCNTHFRKRIDKVSIVDQWCPTCQKKGSSKNVEAISKKLNGIQGVTFTTEKSVKCNGRNLRWDFVVKHGNNMVFHIENDGEQHFSMEKNMLIRRVTDIDIGKEYFRDQRAKDLLKDDHTRTSNGTLFRVTFRQRRQLDKLVEEMIQISGSGVTGVIYMDKELYRGWGPIVYD